jgi:hypothetical protein
MKMTLVGSSFRQNKRNRPYALRRQLALAAHDGIDDFMLA